MKTNRSVVTILLSLIVSGISVAEDYQPKLFKSAELIYEDQFDQDGPHKNTKQWEIRQNSQWNVKDGVLVGGLATEAYQKKMQAIGDGHDGTRTVIFLKPVPKAFVVQMRVQYTETSKKGRNRGHLLDLGHHVNSFIFAKDETILTLQKKKKISIKGDFFPIGQWNDVTLEIKEGEIFIQVNDRKQRIKNPLITLKTDQEFQQIDFKGQDFGTVMIDWVKLYKGVE
ncbi:MAG: hypothetical protein ACKVH8_22650 [Pirellulales bacterium]|jgi:hypothetical protein